MKLPDTYAEWLADLARAAEELGWDVAATQDERTGLMVPAFPLTLHDRTNREIAITIRSVFLDGAMLREILAPMPRV